ncbi:MAG TPA: Lrp/AsnC family transcriptional regulator [Dehalococcoidia bacterium]|nr:Lrp/AsnC family transcriptional regulator [Dehalococcoidia bacterium]
MEDILRILERDARATPDQIARQTGRAADEVARLIKDAEERGIIVRYKTVINWNKVAEEAVTALVEVKVTPQRDVGFDAIAQRIYRFSEARSVYLMSGTYDLLVQLSGPSLRHVSNFISEKLAPLDTVQSTTTHFLMKRYKEDGDILEGVPEDSRRLPVAP